MVHRATLGPQSHLGRPQGGRVGRPIGALRVLAAPFVVAPPSGARIRTRLRLCPEDEVVVRRVGEHLGRLAGGDLADRCRRGGGGDGRALRKRVLTPVSSSRWAGAVTRTSNDQWSRGSRNLVDQRVSLRRAMRVIEAHLAAPVAGRAGRTRGYASPQERFAKQQRLQRLTARLAGVEARLADGRVSVVRGGVRLARVRHHLDVAGLAPAQWQERWQASRLFICADGEADKRWGNETIRVHPEDGARPAGPVVPPHGGGHPHPAVPRPVGGHGHQPGPVRHRRRSRLHQPLGGPTLAGPAPSPDPVPGHRHPPPRGGGGHRTAQPRPPRPATPRCDPTRPEDRQGRATGQAAPGTRRCEEPRTPPGRRAISQPTQDATGQTDQPEEPGDPRPFGAARQHTISDR